jgi:PEGA domain
MVQKLVLFLVVVSVLASGCILSQAPEQGTVQFQSSPPGAQVYLDTMFRGTTPTTVTGITPGNHTLEYRYSGYENWNSGITVSPGPSTMFIAMLPSAAQTVRNIQAVTTPATQAPIPLTVNTGKDSMVVGESQLFSGTSDPGQNVALTLYGPGKYTTGVNLIQASVGADGRWAYTWNPGTSVLAGTYTIVATNAQKTSSARADFTVIGGGLVSVITDRYSYTPGNTITFSGKCTTGSQYVSLSLYGPGQYNGGITLGSQTVNADKSWSFTFKSALGMPTGSYTVYASDDQRTTSASAGFTILPQ